MGETNVLLEVDGSVSDVRSVDDSPPDATVGDGSISGITASDGPVPDLTADDCSVPDVKADDGSVPGVTVEDASASDASSRPAAGAAKVVPEDTASDCAYAEFRCVEAASFSLSRGMDRDWSDWNKPVRSQVSGNWPPSESHGESNVKLVNRKEAELAGAELGYVKTVGMDDDDVLGQAVPIVEANFHFQEAWPRTTRTRQVRPARLPELNRCVPQLFFRVQGGLRGVREGFRVEGQLL
ncbi:hypothetical protein S40288_10726 [Stachybotrys chartarum IBT 40288]|nr:hypothetical protein S40288_10726 [Stachybotrys chartarum IBT 40288]